MNYFNNFLSLTKNMDSCQIISFMDDYVIKTPLNIKEDVPDLIRLLNYLYSEDNIANIWDKIFENHDTHLYLNQFLLPFYSDNEKDKRYFNFYPIKYYLKREKDIPFEILEIIDHFQESNKKKLLTYIIDYNLATPQFYDYFKNQFTLEMQRTIFTEETNLACLDKFKSEFLHLFSENKLGQEHIEKILKNNQSEKITYLIDNFMTSPDNVIIAINGAYAHLSSGTHLQMSHQMIESLIKKDTQQPVLNQDAFLLMAKRIFHCGQINKLPSILQHIKKHHDFHEQFKDIVFSGKTVRIKMKKRVIGIDFNHEDFQKEIKKYIATILDNELKDNSTIFKKIKI